MLVDLNVQGKVAAIVGGGYEAELKALKLLDAGAKVTVIGTGFNLKLRALASKGKLNLAESEPSQYVRLIRSLKPYIFFSATGLLDTDYKLTRAARSAGALVCAVDRPSLNDFNMPAISRIGDIRVAVSTNGLSPAMAKVLRKRIEHLIKPSDVRQVKLQGHIRRLARDAIPDQPGRRRLVYKILRNRRVSDLLLSNRFKEARAHAEEILQCIPVNGRVPHAQR